MGALKLFSRYWSFLDAPVRSRLGLGVLVGIASFGIEVFLSYLLQAYLVVLGLAALPDTTLPSFLKDASLYSIVGLTLLVAVVRAFVLWALEYLRGATGETFRHSIRNQLVQSAFSKQSISSKDLLHAYTERVTNVSVLIMSMQTLISTLILTAGLFLTLVYMQAILTVALLGTAAVVILPLQAKGKKSSQAGKIMAEHYRANIATLTMAIKNLLLLRAYGSVDRERQRIEKALDASLFETKRFFVYFGLMGAIPQFVGTVLASLVLLNRDRIGLEPGAIVTYMFLFTRLATNLSAQAGLVSRIRLLTPDLEALAKSIQEFQTSGVVHQEKPISPEVQRTYDSYFKGPVGWDVKNLEFYYEPGKPLFVGLNLPIQPSTTTVIKGRSGVGKSTLVSLLIGELDPTKGQISLTTADGQAVPLMGVKQSLTRHLGYVGPESFLIEGTVRENLCYGLARNPTDEEIHEAVKTAECQFIYDWELALEHPITEQGQGLSAGQKQRLCLARALLRHPKVLLLDEATANLDSETEERLLETFKKLKTKMTLLIITHRPASLAIADRVVEL